MWQPAHPAIQSDDIFGFVISSPYYLKGYPVIY